MRTFNPWLRRCHSRHDRRERFGTVHLHVARLPALLLLVISPVQERERTHNYQKVHNPFHQHVWLLHTSPQGAECESAWGPRFSGGSHDNWCLRRPILSEVAWSNSRMGGHPDISG